MSRFWRQLGSVVLCLLAAVLILHAIWNWVAGLALQRTLQRQAARGIPMDLEDIRPPGVPEEKNAAVALRRAFVLLSHTNATVLAAPASLLEQDVQGRLHIAATAPERRQEWRQQFEAAPLPELFALLEQAAAMPSCNFEIDYRQGPGLSLAHLAPMRDGARLLALRSWLLADNREYGKALGDLDTSFRLCRHLASEPALVSQLARIGMESVAVLTLNDVLDRMPPSAAPEGQLETMLHGLGESVGQAQSDFVRALDGERILFGKWAFEAALSGGLPPAARQALDITGFSRLYLAYPGKPLLKTDYRHYLLTMEDYRRRAHQLEQSPHAEPHPSFGALAERITPALERCFEHMTARQTLVKQACLGLALTRHHREHGRYPAALEALPLEDRELKVDPFNGKTFVYRRNRAGLVLYSVGPNQKDDGGLRRFPEGGVADIVWALHARPAPGM
jgi:hypothetical protein